MKNYYSKIIIGSLLSILIVGFFLLSRKRTSETESPKLNSIEKATLSRNVKPDTTSCKKDEVVSGSFYQSIETKGQIGSSVDKPIDNPSDNVFHVKIDKKLTGNEIILLEYDLLGISDYTGISRSLNDQLALGGYVVKKSNSWSKQKEYLNPKEIRSGDNVIRFNIREDADYSYQVRNLGIRIESPSNSSMSSNRKLLVNQPSTEYYYGKLGYLRGLLIGDDYENAKILVDGESIRYHKGVFESIIEKPTNSGANWTVRVQAIFPDGQELHTDVSFNKPVEWNYTNGFDKEIHYKEIVVTKTDSFSFGLAKAKLAGKANSLNEDTKLSVTALRDIDIPVLDVGMVNVTAGFSGYRFLPHGTKFSKDISVELGYDTTKIPDGYGINDIRTYFFSEETNHWVAIPKDTTLLAVSAIKSRTNHFSDYINAIIKVPESPETQGYTPTSMKDVKAANPAAGINLIAPPKANSMGNANLNYPINIPAGRQGMQPQLAISYNSGGGNGWLGIGWDLSVPSISVETRWGVPHYDPDKESETYIMMGEQLSPVAYRSAWLSRDKSASATKQFYPRIEGSFNKIIRHGGSPSTYWWEVIDKNGVKYYYGASSTSNGVISDAVLIDSKGNIAHWALVEMRDLNSNFVKYNYSIQVDKGVADPSAMDGTQIYLKSVSYTGSGSDVGSYSVQFGRDRELPGYAKRKDVTINARYGFKQVTADLLKTIEVKFNNETVRSYELSYTEGAFYKTLLNSISEKDASGNVFNKHTFEYYNSVSGGNLISGNSVDYASKYIGVSTDFFGLNNRVGFSPASSALSGSSSWSAGAGLYVGAGLGFNVTSREATAGGSYDYNHSESNGETMLMDLNGDGLPDKVYRQGETVMYKQQLKNIQTGTTTFGEPIKVIGISKFLKEKSNSHSVGLHAFIGATLGVNTTYSESKTTVYFSDVNGDGLPDLVDNGVVYFNRLNTNGTPEFSKISGGTPNPINQSGGVASGIYKISPEEIAELQKQNPLNDVVRMWQAPFDGIIDVDAPIQLIKDESDERSNYGSADGVKATIELNEKVLGSVNIDSKNYSSNAIYLKGISVNKGDRIFFRLNSIDDGAYDQVLWNPDISYENKDLNQMDGSGLCIYNFNSERDFVLTDNQFVGTPIDGVVMIDGSFVKPKTSDNIKIYIFKTFEEKTDTIWSKELNSETDTVIAISERVTVKKGEDFRFKVESSSNIDWAKLSWRPHVYYIESHDEATTEVISGDGKYLIESFVAPEYTMYANQAKIGQVYIASDTMLVSLHPDLKFTENVNSHVTMTLKKHQLLLCKKTFTVDSGAIVERDSILLPILKDDSIYVEYFMSEYVNDNDIISSSYAVKDTSGSVIQQHKAGLFTTIFKEDKIFGNLYRGWGQFVYNANDGRNNIPIKKTLLKINDNLTKKRKSDYEKMTKSSDLNDGNTYSPTQDIFVIMSPDAKRNVWKGFDNSTFIGNNFMSSSRLGEKTIVPFAGGSGARGIDKINKGYNLGATASAGVGGSITEGWNHTETEFSDMNGDKYPDIVTKDKIQFTNPDGSLSELTTEFDAIQKSSMTAVGLSVGGSFAETNQDVTIKSNGITSTVNAKSNGTISGGAGTGTNNTLVSYLDINGDGLPDKVKPDGKVSLNLGYSFAPEENWGGFTSVGNGSSISANGGTGFSIMNGSFAGGISLNCSNNIVESTFVDINGDGLSDFLYKEGGTVKVLLNTGTGFSSPLTVGNISQISKTTGTSASANVSFTFGVTILGAKVVFTPSVNASKGMSRTNIQISDIDGDGLPDFLESENDGLIKVRKSIVGQTNMLKRVNRPLGASFEMEYSQVGNTYEMPQSAWTLSKVTVFDGHIGDGVNTLATSFEYKNGYHNRFERAFYGFGEVKTNQLGNGGEVYRTTIQTFANDNYYRKGLMLSESVVDAFGRKYVETKNDYELKAFTDDKGSTVDNVYFPALLRTDKKFFEGTSDKEKSTYTTFKYGDYGNVVEYFDNGDSQDDADNLRAEISYHKNAQVLSNHILGIPESIKVYSTGGIIRQRSTMINSSTGKITQIKQKLESGDAVYDMSYDSYGNLESVTRPENYRGQRMRITYEYDNAVHSYVVAVRDAYGYNSSSTYEYKFGQLLSTTDINGQETKFEIDNIGRITKITGPYEIALGKEYTLLFKYYHDADIAWAQTQHFDPEHPENPIETAIFIDGLGRVLQTKKDGALFKSKNTEDTEVMIVSGKVEYDAFGRSISTKYPVTESKGRIGQFNSDADNIQATRLEYDVLDRTTKTILPDGTETKTEYGFGKDRNDKLQFMTRVTDANGIKTESFTDINGQQTAVKASGDIWTSFDYNAMSELVKVTDAEGNSTVSVYDMLGRRLSRSHPDAGLTEFTYDKAGNLLTKVTANLKKKGEKIIYKYDYNHLTNVIYPENPVNDVRYEYGKAGDGANCIGRILVQEDATGAQEFSYGPLGEIVKNKRTIIVPDDGVYTFVTSWEYDTWNRLKKMTYPDDEELTYSYNKGGLLHDMYGRKKGHRYNYLTQIGYDKFGNRVYLSYGNGTETNYNYEADRRRLHHIDASTSTGRKMMDNTYTYDRVNNITQLKSSAPIPGIELKGGSFEYSYSYDNLYRLTSATGHFQGSSFESTYELGMDYTAMGCITNKKQKHLSRDYDEVEWALQHKTTYEWKYQYNDTKPHAPSQIGDNKYSYDANGNQTGWQNTTNNQRRDILWDEENRIRAIADNGVTHHYMYDGSGERVIKCNGDGQAIYINGFPMGGSGTVGNYTMYVNPYMVVTNMKYTKHFYIEGQRIVSKLGEMGEYQGLLNPKDTSKAGGKDVGWNQKQDHLKEQIISNFESLGLNGAVFAAGKSGKIPYGQLKKYYRNHNDVVNSGGRDTVNNSTSGNKLEKFQFYYHPDHLGSTSYITNASGEVYQHMEYFPFGETFVDEHSNEKYAPYFYNGKELDNETGLYYYGARYYDPRISMWYGVDRLAEKYPAISPFIYTANNPLKFIDPDGADIVIAGKNNSSVTLTTDMIDITVNASSLGIDFGGTYTLQGEAVLSAGLDIVGVLDPTGVADGLNAVLQAKNGEWGGAIISSIGLISYIGDLAKAGKIGKDIKIIKNAIESVHGNSKLSKKIQHGYEIYNKKTGEILEYGISGQKRSAKQIMEGGSPRINQKLKTKYNNDSNVGGRVIEDNIPNRQDALNWEQQKVDDFVERFNIKPSEQLRPLPKIKTE